MPSDEPVLTPTAPSPRGEGRELFFPELPGLLPRVYHPRAARIEVDSNGWVREFLAPCFPDEDALLFFLRQRNGIYGPLTVPKADESRARDIADWYQYVTVIDSSVSDRGALGSDDGAARRVFASIMADFVRAGDASDTVDTSDVSGEQAAAPAAAAPAADVSPAVAAYGRAATDLWRRISPALSPEQIRRFAASLEAFLRGCAAEIQAKLTDHVPDHNTCLDVRLESFGCEFIELMTEYGAGVDMSALLPELAEVHDHCRRQMIVVNDLLSWRKEQAQDDKMTLLRVMTEHEGMSPQEAVDALVAMVEEHEKAYIAARDVVLGGPLGGREDVAAYLRGLDHLIGGSQEFEYLTPRYYGDGSVWDGATSGWLDLDAPIARFRKEPREHRSCAAEASLAPGAYEAMPARSAAAAADELDAAHCPVDHGVTAAPDEAAPARAAGARPASRRRAGADAGMRVVKAPGGLPVLGHALDLWRRPLEFLAGLPARGDLVEIGLGPKPAFLACHPELVSQVLLDARTFDKGGPLFEKARLLVGNGLVSSEWEDHRVQRRMLQPVFHSARMAHYVSLMREEVAGALEGWSEGRAFDVSDAMHALTLRITARTMFDTSIGDRAVSEVAYCMPIIMRGVYQRMVAPVPWHKWVPTPANRRFDAVRARMHDVIRDTIEEHRDDPGGDDMLSLLVSARDEETGAGLTDEEIYDQVMTLLIGGTETTGNTMAWVFHVLAGHPEIEDRVHAEVDAVTADGHVPGFGDLPRLDYTWRVLHETLRMYPPAWLLTRATSRRTELAGRVLEPGTIVMYSPYALGRNPAYFTDPERFDPDRWLPERAAQYPRGAMVPFSMGNRKCIGDAFGQAETTLTLATVAAHWRLRPEPGARPNEAQPKASLGTGPLMMVPSRRRTRTQASCPA